MGALPCSRQMKTLYVAAHVSGQDIIELGVGLLQAVTAAATEKLDVQLAASGFKKEHFSALDSYVSALQGMVAPRDGSGSSSSSTSDESDDESDDESGASESSGGDAGLEGEGEESGEEEGGESEGERVVAGCSARSAAAADVSESSARSEGRESDQDASNSQGAEGQRAEVGHQSLVTHVDGLSIGRSEGEPCNQQQTHNPPQPPQQRSSLQAG